MLLFILAIAVPVHLLHGQYNVGSLLDYGMAAWVCMSYRRPPRCHVTDDEFIESFQDCSLAVECFHHADHVRMAFLHLSRYPPLQAIQRFSHSPAKFAAAHDKPTLYHETITWAFLLLIRKRMARAGHQRTRVEFSTNNKDLRDDLFRHKLWFVRVRAVLDNRRRLRIPDTGKRL
jgi:hypothetical protein